MAAPVVTVDFTADVLSGASPLTVQFTNTSSIGAGFERKFLWDFGDGTISESENPSHVFTGTGGDTFDVSLAILATTGEFDAISSSILAATRTSNLRLASGGWATNDLAWANLIAAPLTDANAQHTLTFNGAQFFYNTNDPTLDLKSASSSLAFILIETRVDVGIVDIQGVINIDGNVGTPLLTNVWTVFGILEGVTTANPKEVVAQITPQVQLGDPPSGHVWGNEASFRTITYTNTASQSFGEEEKLAYIQIGLPPVAAFSASPTSVPPSLPVQFLNESVEAIGLPTTYSWKKRKTGSGDAFVEFSTAKHPTEFFIK